jgi:hypothetical protein
MRHAADVLLLAGLACFLAGVYLLAGPAWALMALGAALVASGLLTAAREEEVRVDEPDETTAVS